MDPNSTEIAHDFPGFLRIYKDGRIERFMGTETTPAGTDRQTGVQSKDVIINPETGVSARLFLPKSANPTHKLPLLIYIHGGAFCICSPYNPPYHNHLNTVACEGNIVALSVHYRLAPEHPLPIAYDDTWDAIQWAASHAKGSGPEPWLNDHADFGRVYFAGDSAGANLSHNMAMWIGLEKLDGLSLNGIVLIHPFFGNNEQDKLMEYLFPTMEGAGDPRIQPAKDPNLAKLGSPKVLILAAGRDFLRDRAWSYHEALKKSGWSGEVNIEETEGEDHVFHLLNPRGDNSVALVKRFVSFISQAHTSEV